MRRVTSGSLPRGTELPCLRDQAFTFIDIWDDEQFPEVSAICNQGRQFWFGGSARLAHYSEVDEQYT